MCKLVLGLIAASTALAGCSTYGVGYGADRRYSSYDYDGPDPSYGGYDAGRYYRDDNRYR